MHIPDGFLDPKVSASMMGIAAAAFGYSVAKVRAAITAVVKSRAFAAVTNIGASLASGSRRILTKFGEKLLQKMAAVTSLVFAAQMFNFPVTDGTSGHLIGGVLAAVILGPFAGMISITMVLLVQMLFFADGGVIALGANVVNMAVVGTLGCYFLYAFLKKYLPEMIAIFAAAWVSVVLAAAACAVQIGLSGTIPLGTIFLAMFRVHAIIGIAEGFITIALVQIYRKFLNQDKDE